MSLLRRRAREKSVLIRGRREQSSGQAGRKSPFLTAGFSRRHAGRSTQIRVAAAFTVTLALAAVAFFAVQRGSLFSRSIRSRRTTTYYRNMTARHSAAPLPLTLAPATEQVRAPFRHPPRAGLLFDLKTGRVLWGLNPTRVLPVASLTKMMTALLVVRSEESYAHVLITRRAADTPGSKIGLLPVGKHVSVQTLLYGLLLPSGNDAAVALAEAVSHNVSTFVEQMNSEAAQLGLGCTRFKTPDGLDNGDISCAVDLAELAAVDLEQPTIAHIARSASAIVPFPIKGGKLYLYNNNPLLRFRFPGATGLKTGETEAAGRCLVGTAERDGVRLGVVLLHSPELGRQAAYLLSRAFTTVYHQRPRPEQPIPVGL